jgi:hypothetical protein
MAADDSASVAAGSELPLPKKSREEIAASAHSDEEGSIANIAVTQQVAVPIASEAQATRVDIKAA